MPAQNSSTPSDVSSTKLFSWAGRRWWRLRMMPSACDIASRISSTVLAFTISASTTPGGFTRSWTGERAGATLEHTHSQLIATPIIPRFLQEELEGARRYYELKERCVFCDIVHQETADNNGRRVVAKNDRFVALEPFAPRFPFETWILPRRHDASYQDTADTGEYLDLAALLKDTLQRLNRALDRPPFNFVLHTAPVSDGDLEYYHWHLEIMPNLTRVAGFEMGSGFHINPTPPEDAAQYLREIAAEAAGDPGR